MRHQFLLVVCVLLTAAAIHTAAQIEYKNLQCECFLPRSPSDVPVPKWEIPELDDLLASLDDKFYQRREEAAIMAAHFKATEAQELAAESAPVSQPETAASTATVSSAAKLLAAETDPQAKAITEVAGDPTADAAPQVTSAVQVTTAPQAASPPVDIHYGAPYSEQEQRTIDSMTCLHADHLDLRWWVGSFGIAQYFLAPAAFLLALVCAVSLPGALKKSTAGFCAFLCAGCIFLMLVRGYWHAMGTDLATFTVSIPFVNNLFV